MFQRLLANKKLLIIGGVVLIVGFFVYSYFAGRTTAPTTLTIENNPQILNEQRSIYAKTQQEFRGADLLGYKNKGLSFEVFVQNDELENLNKDSYVFTFTNYSGNSFPSELNVTSTDSSATDRFKFTINGTADSFMTAYLNKLNSTMPQNLPYPATFTTHLLSERSLILDAGGGEFRTNLLAGESATHRESTYNLYLNNNLVTSTSGYSVITVVRPLKSGGNLTVSVPKFLPQEVTVQSKKDFEGGNVSMKPAVSNDPKFVNTLLSEGLQLKSTDFSVSKGAAEKIYVLNPDAGYLVPFMAKRATLPSVQGLRGVGYYIASY